MLEAVNHRQLRLWFHRMKRSAAAGLACETWQLVFELLQVARPHVPSVAAACGLTPAQCHVLRLLEPGAAVSMRHLAERLGCDASNVTGLVDRLEARGLMERRPAERDRRVKKLALTATGAALRARLLERLSEPPELLDRLAPADQRALRDLLRKALRKG